MSAQDHLSGLEFSEVTLPHGAGQGDIHVADETGIVGHLRWQHNIGATITSVAVSPAHQHKGIAAEMDNRASEAVGYPLGHDATRTNAGEGWAHHVGGKIPPRIKAAE